MSEITTRVLAIGLMVALCGPRLAHAQTTSAADEAPPVESTTGPATTTTTTQSSATSTSSGTTGASAAPRTTTTTHASSTSGHATSSVPAGAGTVAAPPDEEEEDEGDGRDVDFLWIEAMGGISNVNLVAFSGGGILDGTSTDPSSGATSVFNEITGTGPMVGGALGFRIYWIAVAGARATFASFDKFQIGNVGGEIALRLPIPVVEPYARVGFGYAWQGDANYTVTTGGGTVQPATTVYGWSFSAALGVDIFLANWFTIGAGVGLDLLNMARQSDPRMSCMGATDFCPSRPGDAVGYQLSGFGQIGFHI